MRSRGRRTCSALNPAARAIRRSSGPDAPPGCERTSRGDIATGPPHALPRNGLRQHLHQRPCMIDGVGIDHAVAAIRDRIAGLDPDRRNRQRQRRIGRCADEVTGAQRPAVGGSDIATAATQAACGISAAMQPSASASGSSTGVTGREVMQQRRERHVERSKRGRQALVWVPCQLCT